MSCMDNNIYCDEQNGFCPDRSCVDHIYLLTALFRNRKYQEKSTYACFIDAEKAFAGLVGICKAVSE